MIRNSYRSSIYGMTDQSNLIPLQNAQKTLFEGRDRMLHGVQTGMVEGLELYRRVIVDSVITGTMSYLVEVAANPKRFAAENPNGTFGASFLEFADRLAKAVVADFSDLSKRAG